MELLFVCLAAHDSEFRRCIGGVDRRICQTFCASPAEPGELLLGFRAASRNRDRKIAQCHADDADGSFHPSFSGAKPDWHNAFFGEGTSAQPATRTARRYWPRSCLYTQADSHDGRRRTALAAEPSRNVPRRDDRRALSRNERDNLAQPSTGFSAARPRPAGSSAPRPSGHFMCGAAATAQKLRWLLTSCCPPLPGFTTIHT